MFFNILVLVSGNGTNLQSLIDAEKKGTFGADFKIAAVLSDRRDAYALERARAAGIPAVFAGPDHSFPKDTQVITNRKLELSNYILRLCKEKQINLIVFAGFLSILEGEIIKEYEGKMINLHPALLPKFGGRGMYGEHVHKAVLEAGETESGCTVHLVDGGTDTGQIILQRRVHILATDSPESLAQRIHNEEHIAIVEAVQIMIERLQII